MHDRRILAHQADQLLEHYFKNINKSVKERGSYETFQTEEQRIRKLSHEDVIKQLEQNDLHGVLAYIKKKGARRMCFSMHALSALT